jgi:hypothetical protein
MTDTETRLLDMLKRPGPAFAWGRHDCFLWAADAVHALTGRDPAADLRGTYSTARGALRRLRALGGMQALAAQRFGPQVPVAQAQAGAVVLLPPAVCVDNTGRWGALGVVVHVKDSIGWGLVVAQGDAGYVMVNRSKALAAWQGGSAWAA